MFNVCFSRRDKRSTLLIKLINTANNKNSGFLLLIIITILNKVLLFHPLEELCQGRKVSLKAKNQTNKEKLQLAFKVVES